MRSLADIDPAALTPAARFVFDRILWQNSVEERPIAELAQELKLTASEIREAIEFLGAEIEASLGGAVLPKLEQAQYEALRDDIAANGQLVPILVDSAGKTIDGENRTRACRELGLAPVVRQVDPPDLYAAGLSVNLNRRQLSSAQKRRIVRVELLRDPGQADRKIARTIGVDHKTVSSVRRELDQLRALLTNPAARQDTPPPPAPTATTVLVDEDTYGTLRAIAAAAAAYYERHRGKYPDPELEELLERLEDGKSIVVRGEIPQAAVA